MAVKKIISCRSGFLGSSSKSPFESSLVAGEEGQSIFEFMLMLPMMLSLAYMLIKINTAIQISIVDQQYARAQTLFLAFNSPYYPSLQKQAKLASLGSNQMVLGVSDNADSDGSETYTPQATTQEITRNNKIIGPDNPGEEPPKRAKVRIRNTVTLCTQTLTVSGKNGLVPILKLDPKFEKAEGLSALNDEVRFANICGSKMTYEQ